VSEPEEQPVEEPKPVKFTKDAQPELPPADRRKKAGISVNRIGIWVIGAAFALYLIITGIVGILTKAR
jgi:hypothetical protein